MYSVVYADPPWSYRDKQRNKSGGKYGRMSADEIANVLSLATHPDALLFCWATWPTLPEALGVLRAAGWSYRTIGFLWAKLSTSGESWHVGMGFYTRANTEPCLLAVRGHPAIRSHGVRSLVVAPRREHSRKPDEVRGRIVALAGDVRRVELFARQRADGWDRWGDEAPGGAGLIRRLARGRFRLASR